MTQKPTQEEKYPPVHYIQVNEICYLKDMNKGPNPRDAQHFNSDRETFTSIAQKLYKKIVKQGYIEKARQFAIPQTKKKVENMYDLSDKWINDEEAFTEPETQKNVTSQFSQYKAISGVSIEEFYDSRFKRSPVVKSPVKIEKSRPVNSKLNVNELLKSNQLTVVKYDQLKKKIQWSLRNTSPYKPIQK